MSVWCGSTKMRLGERSHFYKLYCSRAQKAKFHYTAYLQRHNSKVLNCWHLCMHDIMIQDDGCILAKAERMIRSIFLLQYPIKTITLCLERTKLQPKIEVGHPHYFAQIPVPAGNALATAAPPPPPSQSHRCCLALSAPPLFTTDGRSTAAAFYSRCSLTHSLAPRSLVGGLGPEVKMMERPTARKKASKRAKVTLARSLVLSFKFGMPWRLRDAISRDSFAASEIQPQPL